MNGLRRAAWLSLLFALAVAGRAGASPRVAVVRGEHEADPEGLEPRLRAELESAGFEVVIVRVEQPASRDQLEATARRTESFAAIALIRPAGGEAVDVWVIDRVTGKTVLRRIEAPTASAETGSILAVRAVELLRASLIELHLRTTPSGEIEPEPEVERFAELPKEAVPPPRPEPVPPKPKPEKPRPVAPPPRPAPHYAFGLALEGVVSPGGLDLAFAPGASFFWQPAPEWALGLSIVGPALETLS